jgi:hypothetical protein
MVALLVTLASAPVAQTTPPPPRVRFATFNVALNRAAAGQLAAELRGGDSAQAHAIAEIVQHARPDVLLLNELDYDEAGAALAALCELYLGKPHGDAPAIEFPHRFLAPVNTGVPSGLDLDGDGKTNGPGDALGYGAFPGQYGMAVLSRFPIDTAAVRTFQDLRWRDMPGAELPDDPATPERADYYSSAALEVLRLSSKSHWDVPIALGEHVVHLLASHPTPPVFDGPEDRNGRRNSDEIRFWADYIELHQSTWIRDDAGKRAGLLPDTHFVIAGDLNADPVDGDSQAGAIAALLEHRRIAKSNAPQSAGSQAAARLQGGANARHRGDPATDTGDFSDRNVGNLRLDYVLPSRTLAVRESGVFWPTPDEPHFRLVGDGETVVSSDHRLVWIEVAWPVAKTPSAAPQLIGQPFGDLGRARLLAPFNFADHELTLVRWWTDTCPFCADTLPALDTLRARFGPRGLAVVGMYHPKPPRDVTDDVVREQARALAVDADWTKLADLQARGATRQATSISVLVDRAGKIVWFHPGPRLHPAQGELHRAAGAEFAQLGNLILDRLR